MRAPGSWPSPGRPRVRGAKCRFRPRRSCILLPGPERRPVRRSTLPADRAGTPHPPACGGRRRCRAPPDRLRPTRRGTAVAAPGRRRGVRHRGPRRVGELRSLPAVLRRRIAHRDHRRAPHRGRPGAGRERGLGPLARRGRADGLDPRTAGPTVRRPGARPTGLRLPARSLTVGESVSRCRGACSPAAADWAPASARSADPRRRPSPAATRGRPARRRRTPAAPRSGRPPGPARWWRRARPGRRRRAGRPAATGRRPRTNGRRR